MANIKSNAILTVIRQQLEGYSAGAVRAIASGTYAGDLPDGLADTEQARRAMATPRFSVGISSLERHPASPPVNGSLMLYRLGVEVRAIRTVTRLEQLSDADADSLRALAVADADVIRQALEYPQRLAGTLPVVAGVGGTFPTGFTGGEDLDLLVNGTAVNVAFTSADQTAAECAATIAAAMSSAGVGDAATVVNEQLSLAGPTTGTGSSLSVAGGTAAATLGLTGLSSAGVNTDLASGLITYAGSRVVIRRAINDGAQLLETVHSFTGVAKVYPAVA